MDKKRRDFLKLTGLSGIGLATAQTAFGHTDDYISDQHTEKKYIQKFNMSGYAAPKLPVVRVGFIGLGNRGMAAVERMNKIEGVQIKALCDLRAEKVEEAAKMVSPQGHQPKKFYTGADAWKQLCEMPDIDLVYIVTPWALHTPMAVFSMNHDKHVCVEVPAAKTIEECWQLVETSERTRKHCMMTENCCYDFSELLTLNMARQGFFGEITHGEGAYLHNLQEYVFSKDRFYQMWELEELSKRTGNLYPTHGLGPICQVMNINRGDQMDYLVSMSNNDFIMGETAKKLAADDLFFKPYVGRHFNGMINTSTIRTHKGKTILVQFDVSSPRPYSRIQLVSGTKGTALKYPEPARYSKDHEWLTAEEYKAVEEKYTPPIIKKIGEAAKQVGGHGGMDFLMDWRTIDCLRNGLPLDQDVYDAALWSSIGPLSEWSVAHRSNSIDVPDFTSGSWKTNKPVDISMKEGGNTKVLL
ncbi:Gfo/Idh/MocA family protein [Dyadobacter subterraneus]|uniref:Gfo/Idh/MocA family oxidoreductase n=1 Tax=Dyadobacter subterraneus TaxID=2773304 RepID=A0ABR9W991_9BACT|nr:Gfo/Idh/MocA family oxidoreductase [Dyadobacter subterraneus]MBE9461506.1 Gfo/Idh/MocA family oxidoreductase [Dyadobacter subterraneus]